MADEINVFFPRPEGSSNEKKVLEYIENKLTADKIEFSRFEFNNSINYHSFSSSLIVKLKGNSSDTLLITIPLNHPVSAQSKSDGSINISLGLALINYFKNKKLPLSIQINFMGAEFGKSADYPLGSTLFLEHFFPDYPVMQLYLNLDNIPRRLLIKSGGNKIVSPDWMITRCAQALRSVEIPFLLRGNENQLFRLGLSTEKNNSEPYLARDFPSLSFEGEYASLTETERRNWLFNFISFFDTFLEKFSGGIPEEWDRHYLFFQVYDFFLIINEKNYVIAIILLFFSIAVYILIYSRIFKRILFVLLRNLWIIFVIFILLFLYLQAASLILGGISYYKVNIDLWQSNPLLFLLLKVCLVLFFFSLTRNLLKFIPFIDYYNYYSSAGFFLLFIITLVVMFINISSAYYILWAFLFFMLSNIMKKMVLKILAFLVSTYWIAKSVIELFILKQPLFCKALLLSSVTDTLIIAVFLLPFILQVIALLKKAYFNLVENLHFLTILILLLASLGLGLYFAVFIGHSEENLQTVSVKDLVDTDTGANTIELTDISPLGLINLWINNDYYYIDTRATRYIIPLQFIPDLMKIENTQQAFLDRKNITLSLTAKRLPVKVNLLITSEKEFTLFDSNFPFRRRQMGTAYEILIGVNPPNPLPIQLTLPAGHTFQLQFNVEYTEFPFRFEVTGMNKEFDSKLILKKTLKIET